MRGILAFVGFMTAVVMIVGMMYKSNYRLVRTTDATPAAAFDQSAATTAGGEDEFSGFASQQTAPSASARARAYSSAAPTGTAGSYHEPPAAPAEMISAADIREWVSRQGPVAVMEAVRQGVPAGLSLAVGIEHLRAGRLRAGDDFVRHVVQPLVQIQQQAGGAQRQHFKYRANSKAWITGLDALGRYPAADLLQTLERYDLAAYDAEVYLALQDDERSQRSPAARAYEASVIPVGQREKEQPSTEQRARQEVADEDLRGNMAYSMNRLVDRKLEDQGQAMRFRAASPAASTVKSEARRRAEAIRPGQRVRFDDPATFQAVLRELLALEAGYDSWESYVAADRTGARAVFNRRSDIMSLGGVLEITRKR